MIVGSVYSELLITLHYLDQPAPVFGHEAVDFRLKPQLLPAEHVPEGVLGQPRSVEMTQRFVGGHDFAIAMTVEVVFGVL